MLLITRAGKLACATFQVRVLNFFGSDRLRVNNRIPRYTTSREVNEARRPHTCSTPCAFGEKTKRKTHTHKPAPPKTHHEINSSPATATTSRRRATKHVPCVCPYPPASIDPGFVEIGLVQLSQSVKTTNVTHTLTDTQTDRRTDRQADQLNNGTLYAPQYEEAFLPIGKKRPH